MMMFEKLRHLARDIEAKNLNDKIEINNNTKSNVLVYSKGYFEKMLTHLNINDSNVEEQEDVYISLLNTDDVGDNVPYFNENKRNVLVLKFDDIDETQEFSPGKFAKAFTEEQGQELLDFVNANSNAIKNGKCLVHCSAGVSRSGAVGTFIVDHLELNRKVFLSLNRSIMPNPRVTRIMNYLTLYKHYD